MTDGSRALAAMKAVGLETAVVWGRTVSTFDRAGDVIYLNLLQNS